MINTLILTKVTLVDGGHSRNRPIKLSITSPTRNSNDGVVRITIRSTAVVSSLEIVAGKREAYSFITSASSASSYSPVHGLAYASLNILGLVN